MKYAIIHSNTEKAKGGWITKYLKYENEVKLQNHLDRYYKDKPINLDKDVDAKMLRIVLGKKKFEAIKEAK